MFSTLYSKYLKIFFLFFFEQRKKKKEIYQPYLLKDLIQNFSFDLWICGDIKGDSLFLINSYQNLLKSNNIIFHKFYYIYNVR